MTHFWIWNYRLFNFNELFLITGASYIIYLIWCCDHVLLFKFFFFLFVLLTLYSNFKENKENHTNLSKFILPQLFILILTLFWYQSKLNNNIALIPFVDIYKLNCRFAYLLHIIFKCLISDDNQTTLDLENVLVILDIGVV